MPLEELRAYFWKSIWSLLKRKIEKREVFFPKLINNLGIAYDFSIPRPTENILVVDVVT